MQKMSTDRKASHKVGDRAEGDKTLINISVLKLGKNDKNSNSATSACGTKENSFMVGRVVKSKFKMISMSQNDGCFRP